MQSIWGYLVRDVPADNIQALQKAYRGRLPTNSNNTWQFWTRERSTIRRLVGYIRVSRWRVTEGNFYETGEWVLQYDDIRFCVSPSFFTTVCCGSLWHRKRKILCHKWIIHLLYYCKPRSWILRLENFLFLFFTLYPTHQEELIWKMAEKFLNHLTLRSNSDFIPPVLDVTFIFQIMLTASFIILSFRRLMALLKSGRKVSQSFTHTAF